jgi:hypothetical protein
MYNLKACPSDFKAASKKISQLIAMSWLPGGEEMKEIFLSGDSEMIQKLLIAHGIDMTEFEIKLIIVNWDSFYGDMTERGFVYSMPYPPRPQQVTDDQLAEWVKDNNPEELFPKTPYIPQSFL